MGRDRSLIRNAFEEGAVMQIEFNCNSWIDIDKNNAKLISYTIPK